MMMSSKHTHCFWSLLGNSLKEHQRLKGPNMHRDIDLHWTRHPVGKSVLHCCGNICQHQGGVLFHVFNKMIIFILKWSHDRFRWFQPTGLSFFVLFLFQPSGLSFLEPFRLSLWFACYMLSVVSTRNFFLVWLPFMSFLSCKCLHGKGV